MGYYGGSGGGGVDYSQYILQVDEDGSYLYRGYAAPGSATSDPAWRIERFDFSADPDVTKLYADGEATFDKTWDNRTSLTYS